MRKNEVYFKITEWNVPFNHFMQTRAMRMRGETFGWPDDTRNVMKVSCFSYNYSWYGNENEQFTYRCTHPSTFDNWFRKHHMMTKTLCQPRQNIHLWKHSSFHHFIWNMCMKVITKAHRELVNITKQRTDFLYFDVAFVDKSKSL